MHPKRKKSRHNFLDYVPASYHDNKDSYVEFYAVDPESGNLKRSHHITSMSVYTIFFMLPNFFLFVAVVHTPDHR